MTESTCVFDTLMYTDERYFTEDHCDINNWTADFDEFCKEFNLTGVNLTGKYVGCISAVDNTLNYGKKADPHPRDRAKLRESYEKNGVDKTQYPICVLKTKQPVNGGTRLHSEVLPKLGVKAYCFWEVEFDSELDRIDFENKVNDPETKFYSRQNDSDDVEVGVLAYAEAYKEQEGDIITEEQLQAKIEDYGGNSLTKAERNALLKKIMAGDVPVKPARYKTWTNQTFRAWMNTDKFTDSRKSDCISDPSKYWLQNAKNGARWRQHIDEMYRCATFHTDQSPHPMHQIVITPPPDEDGKEMQERLDFYNDREKLYRKLDAISMYKFKNGRYPAQHVEAELLFAPSSFAEVEEGKLIDWPEDVLAAIATKKVREKKESE